MSSNEEIKALAKSALSMGLAIGKPLAKKALNSKTVQTAMLLGVDMATDVLSSVTMERSKKETPKKPWNETGKEDIFVLNKERLKQENPELYKKLSETPKTSKS